MASKEICSRCSRTASERNCTGCDKKFCAECFGMHRQNLNQELEKLDQERDLFKNALDQSFTSQECFNAFKQKIDEWEQERLAKVKMTADHARKDLKNWMKELGSKFLSKFSRASETLKSMRRTQNYAEADLNLLKKQLDSLKNDLNELKNRHGDLVFEETKDRISWQKLMDIQSRYDDHARLPAIPTNASWSENATISISDVSRPHGIAVDRRDGTVFVADRENKRIFSWNPETNLTKVLSSNLESPTDVLIDEETNSIIIADRGKEKVLRCSLDVGTPRGEIMINNITCHGLAMDKEGSLYVSDDVKDEVRKYPKGKSTGILVAGGNGKGRRNHQLNRPYYIAVDDDDSLYVSDCCNHRIMKWMKGATQGIRVAGGSGEGSNNNQLFLPQGIKVDSDANLYVADGKNQRIMRWRKGEEVGEIIVGGNGIGKGVNQFHGPTCLDFDKNNNFYVTDWKNNCVKHFLIE